MKKTIFVALFCLIFVSQSWGAYKINNNIYANVDVYKAFADLQFEGDANYTIEPQQYSLFLGYRFFPNFRWDFEFTIIAKTEINNRTPDVDPYKYNATAMLFNLYFDFWDMETNIATPFVSIGGGLGSPKVSRATTVGENTLEIEEIEWTKSNFAWQAQAGVTVRVTNNFYVLVKCIYLVMPVITNEKDLEFTSFNSSISSVGLGVSILI
ncbi:MAG: porin family protein [Elusimicrobiota bacterium]|jgi:opacity protein-like surface antigen|nr:porin family protein [Elusimicrobiota bacterium]